MNYDLILSTLYPACVSAYDATTMPAFALKLPKGCKLVGEIKAGETVWGVVLQSADAVIVAFRGTENFHDWIRDFTAMPVNLPFEPYWGSVHEGASQVYSACRDSLRELLELSSATALKTYFTGHSLGAMLAMLAAVEYRQRDPETWTFAGPRLGTHAFVKDFDQFVGNLTRIVNFGDLVPDVPLEPLYHHAGVQVLVQGGFELHDASFAHHLSTYLYGLRQLISQE